MELSLSVFTLNCWGIPVVSKNRRERVQALVTYLKDAPYDVICLQEIWSESDFDYIKENLLRSYPFSHYFFSGVLGSGLCVFSKWIIQDVFFHKWPLNGYIHKIHHGDWFGGKGVGLCRIKFHDKLINVYCTHLHAEYNEDDIYLAHRVLQAYSTAEFVNLTTYPAAISILAGDLNTGPGDLSYRIISEVPVLLDPYDSNIQNDNPLIRMASGTSDNINNSYSDPKQTSRLPEGKRIDHILYHVNSSWEAQVVNFGNPLPDRVPGEQFSYSDHNPVMLELKLRQSKENKQTKDRVKHVGLYEVIAQAIKVCEEAKDAISTSKKIYVTTGGLILMFLVGTVGFWPNYVLYDFVKILLTAFGFYYIMMGTLWNKIEMNSLKAGISALENFNRCQNELSTK